LPEILLVALEAHAARDVEQAEHPDRAVDEKAPGLAEAFAGVALQEVVDDVQRSAQVAGEVRHPLAHELRHDLLVALRDGLESVPVDPLVEAVDAAVHRFPGIGLRALDVRRHVGGTTGGAKGRQEERADPGRAGAIHPGHGCLFRSGGKKRCDAYPMDRWRCICCNCSSDMNSRMKLMRASKRIRCISLRSGACSAWRRKFTPCTRSPVMKLYSAM